MERARRDELSSGISGSHGGALPAAHRDQRVGSDDRGSVQGLPGERDRSVAAAHIDQRRRELEHEVGDAVTEWGDS